MNRDQVQIGTIFLIKLQSIFYFQTKNFMIFGYCNVNLKLNIFVLWYDSFQNKTK